MIRTAKVKIHGGDYDCSESVRMCYAAAGVLPWGYWDSYMWTGNEREMLTSHGFAAINVASADKMRRGDVLLKSGHTELYLGNGKQAGARGDERGGIGYGSKKGDQTGNELAEGPYRGTAQWTSAFRYVGSHTVDGIPAAEVAAQVMEHLVMHDAAHGYSQPARAGDGTTEEITIRWDDGKEIIEEDDMNCMITIKGRNTVVWFDGINVNDLTTVPDITVLDKIYKATHDGKAMPRITLDEEEFARLCQSIKGGFPKHLKAIVDKYPTRSPE
ncbi:MAG: hypothetical protein IJ092_01445 [Atopobiaceae bacterium]|nr:hypothetical protein [Atopobiaceae bacterium]